MTSWLVILWSDHFSVANRYVSNSLPSHGCDLAMTCKRRKLFGGNSECFLWLHLLSIITNYSKFSLIVNHRSAVQISYSIALFSFSACTIDVWSVSSAWTRCQYPGFLGLNSFSVSAPSKPFTRAESFSPINSRNCTDYYEYEWCYLTDL